MHWNCFSCWMRYLPDNIMLLKGGYGNDNKEKETVLDETFVSSVGCEQRFQMTLPGIMKILQKKPRQIQSKKMRQLLMEQTHLHRKRNCRRSRKRIRFQIRMARRQIRLR